MSDRTKKIYEDAIKHLNDVAVKDRFKYKLFVNPTTWFKLKKSERQELVELMETECNSGIELSKYIEEDKFCLVNTRLFSPDIFEMKF